MTDQDPGFAAPIEAVLFDLDDTLFLQEHWLRGAWVEVASQGERSGLDGAALLEALTAIAAQGSAQGRIIDRALAAIGETGVNVAALVEAFRAYRPEALPCQPGVATALAALRSRVPVGLVTDGEPSIQQGKLHALGLLDSFDVVVLSDELGRDRRKPHPAPFRAALEAIGVPASAAVFVGDRPDKDIVGSSAVGMRSIRVRTGEYANAPDESSPWATAPDALGAIAIIYRFMDSDR